MSLEAMGKEFFCGAVVGASACFWVFAAMFNCGASAFTFAMGICAALVGSILSYVLVAFVKWHYGVFPAGYVSPFVLATLACQDYTSGSYWAGFSAVVGAAAFMGGYVAFWKSLR